MQCPQICAWDGKAKKKHHRNIAQIPDGMGVLVRLTPGASLRGTVFNLVNTVMGGGILGLPFAFKQTGLFVAPFMIVFVGCMSTATIYMLVYAMDATRERSYARVTEILYGPTLSLCVDFTIITQILGTGISYIVIIGDLLPPFMRAMHAPWFLTDRAYCITVVYSLFILPICCLKKLDSLRYVSLVCLLVILLLVAVLTGMGCGLLQRGSSVDLDVAPHLLPESASDLIQQVPVMFFAFICQMNVPILYGELRRQRHEMVDSKFKTKRMKMMCAVVVAMSIVTFCYELCGIFGHISFRDQTSHDILKNLGFGEGGPSFAPYVKASYAIAIVCSYPVMAFSGVESVHAMVWHVRFAFRKLTRGKFVGDAYMEAPMSPDAGLFASPGDIFSPTSTMSPVSSPQLTPRSPGPRLPMLAEDEPHRNPTYEVIEHHDGPPTEQFLNSGTIRQEPRLGVLSSVFKVKKMTSDVFGPKYQLPGESFLSDERHYEKMPGKKVPPAGTMMRVSEVVVFTGISYVLGVLCPDLSISLGLTGSLSSSAIMYILPGLFFYRVKGDEGSFVGKMVGLAFIIFGFLASIICSTMVLRSLF
mmetsp:Transcript_27217/g.71671  ORF Transcript_27217/g.71671 Transcript_27217/m.71671 type:complete len:587 (-) Transcript_27217:254-2014(-)